jgi:hypothetical protein
MRTNIILFNQQIIIYYLLLINRKTLSNQIVLKNYHTNRIVIIMNNMQPKQQIKIETQENSKNSSLLFCLFSSSYLTHVAFAHVEHIQID